MRTRLFAIVPLALAAGLLVGSMLPGAGSAQEVVLTATLTGEAEVPGPGSATGTGAATVALSPDQGTVCYELSVALDPPASAAHIHRGGADEAGPIVVPFEAPTGGSSSGCTPGVDPALVAEIMQNPAGFYVNVHTPDFPAGAIRGQLGQ